MLKFGGLGVLGLSACLSIALLSGCAANRDSVDSAGAAHREQGDARSSSTDKRDSSHTLSAEELALVIVKLKATLTVEEIDAIVAGNASHPEIDAVAIDCREALATINTIFPSYIKRVQFDLAEWDLDAFHVYRKHIPTITLADREAVSKAATSSGHFATMTLAGVMHLKGYSLDVDIERARQFLLVPAQAGFALAQAEYAAVVYDLGTTTEEKLLCLPWAEKAMEQGSLRAIHIYCYALTTARRSPEELTKVRALALGAANRGESRSQFLLGRLYRNGLGGPVDAKEAFRWNSAAALSGLSEARAQLGADFIMGYSVEKNVENGFKWAEKAHLEGDAYGSRVLAFCYVNGWGVEVDRLAAYELFKVGAERGDSDSMFRCGNANDQGWAGERNMPAAIEWYKKSAEKNYAPAQSKLGEIYEAGRGVQRDMTTAIMWYRKAADNGYCWAQNTLATIYMDGNGVEVDDFEALKLLEKAAVQEGQPGCIQSWVNLGTLYEYGRGTEVDYEEAAKWYRKAYEAGNNWAPYRLGRLYGLGNGVELDEKEAARLYAVSASPPHNYSPAQYSLALCYWNGRGVEVDKAKAVEWMTKSARSYHRGAIELLPSMKEELEMEKAGKGE